MDCRALAFEFETGLAVSWFACTDFETLCVGWTVRVGVLELEVVAVLVPGVLAVLNALRVGRTARVDVETLLEGPGVLGVSSFSINC